MKLLECGSERFPHNLLWSLYPFRLSTLFYCTITCAFCVYADNSITSIWPTTNLIQKYWFADYSLVKVLLQYLYAWKPIENFITHQTLSVIRLGNMSLHWQSWYKNIFHATIIYLLMLLSEVTSIKYPSITTRPYF